MFFALSCATIHAEEPPIAETKEGITPAEMFIEEAPSETFIDFFSGFYEDTDSYTIFTTSNDDITENFYKNTKHFYERNDYAGLKKYIWEHEQIAGGCQNVIVPQTRAFGVDSAYQSFYKLIRKGTTPNGINFNLGGEMRYSISGSYSWNISTGKIATYSNPVIKIEVINLGAAFSESMENINTKATVSADKFSITFSGTFKLKVTFSIPLGKIPIGIPLDCGTYSATAKGYVH